METEKLNLKHETEKATVGNMRQMHPSKFGGVFEKS